MREGAETLPYSVSQSETIYKRTVDAVAEHLRVVVNAKPYHAGRLIQK